MKDAETYIIIPVFNEAKVVADVVKKVQKYFDNVICVNDGSSDKSGECITKTGGTLVEHAINLGAGAATQTGVDYALQFPEAKYFVTFDADGQHDIKDAVKMLKYLKQNDLDIVLGSRFIGKVYNISRAKRVFLNLGAYVSNKTSKVKLTDPHIGLRAFNRNFAENLKLTLPDFSHASEVLYRISEGKYKYAEVPVTVTYSDYSKAKGQPMLNVINITIDLLFHRISQK